MKYLPHILMLASIILAGCNEPQSHAPSRASSTDVEQAKGLEVAFTPVPAEKLEGKIKNAWTFQATDEAKGCLVDVIGQSISAKFIVRVEIVGGVVRSTKVLDYPEKCYGHHGSEPTFTDQFKGKTSDNLKVDAISGATNTCNTVTDSVKAALEFAKNLQQVQIIKPYFQ